MKDTSHLKKQLFLSLLTLASLISSMLIQLFSPSYIAQVSVSTVLILSALSHYHISNRYQKGKALLVNRLGTAGFVFMGASNIAEPYIGPVGSIVFVSLALLLTIPAIWYETIETKKMLNDNNEE